MLSHKWHLTYILKSAEESRDINRKSKEKENKENERSPNQRENGVAPAPPDYQLSRSANSVCPWETSLEMNPECYFLKKKDLYIKIDLRNEASRKSQ